MLQSFECLLKLLLPDLKLIILGNRPHGLSGELLVKRPLVALLQIRPVLTSEIPDVVSGVYYAAFCRGFCCFSGVDQTVCMCLLVFYPFLKYLRVSCELKLL